MPPTFQRRYLLRSGPELNRRFVGILAPGQRLYDVRIHAVACLSNPSHGLLRAKAAWHLAGFMNYVQGTVAREAGALHDRKGPFWGDRYLAVLVSEEPEVQYRRLSCCLAQGTKEGLVAHPSSGPTRRAESKV